MDVFDKARELGEMILESSYYTEMKEKEEAQLNDEQALTMLAEYNKFSKTLAEEARGEVTAERMEEMRNLVAKKNQELMENPVIADYVKARNAFDNMLNQVNSIISYYISGQENSGGCSGSCSSCGGCH